MVITTANEHLLSKYPLRKFFYLFSFLKKDIYLFLNFIYLLMRDTERERQRHSQREEQAPCREPDVGLDPGSPRSCPGPKVVLNC